MTYRMLPAEEWYKLIPFAGEKANLLPAPNVAMCAVAEDAYGAIQGAVFLQLVFHMDSGMLKTPYARYDRLMDLIHQSVSGNPGLVYYTFSESEKVSKMLEKQGFERMPYVVYQKEVR